MPRTTWHNDISTPIPAEVNPQNVINILHNHGTLITLSPIVTRYEEAKREGSKITYDVWENIDFLPFGLWKREIQFTCSFEDTADGVISWIQAPLGLTSQATYSVRPGQDGWEGVLDESIDSECNIFLKAFVEATMVSTRKKMHATILERARGQTA